MNIVLIILLVIIGIFIIINTLNRAFFYSLFRKGNCIVTGLRGCGKDMAFCLAINHFKKNYISNVEYSSPKKRYKHFEFEPKVWELAQNTYKNFINGDLKKYTYPYPDGLDYYISDAGIYFPSQYCNELIKIYGSAPLFQALSRHLGNCNVHCNVQNIQRLWDKIREQSDLYICMKGCKVLFGKIVFLRGCVYETYEACVKQLTPPKFGIGKEAKNRRIMYETTNGRIRTFFFFSRMPYRYDDRRFKRMLENGCIDYNMEVKK